MEIHSQTTDDIVAVEKVAEQHIGTRTNNKRDIGTLSLASSFDLERGPHQKIPSTCFPIGCFHIPNL